MAAQVIEPTGFAALEPPPQIKAMLFGWDGILFDNNDFNFEVLRDAFAQLGIEPSVNWLRARADVPLRALIIEASRRARCVVDPNVVIAERNRIATRRLGSLRPNRALHQLIERHRGTLLMGVVTGLERCCLTAPLRSFGLETAFDVIVTRDDVLRHKPHPDGVHAACRNLNVAPADVQVFERSAEGLTAAARGGVGRVIDLRKLVASSSQAPGNSRYMLDFALRWLPYGGGHAGDILVHFGLTEHEFFSRLHNLLVVNSPTQLKLDPQDAFELISLCADRTKFPPSRLPSTRGDGTRVLLGGPPKQQ